MMGQSEHYGVLQELVNDLYASQKVVTSMELVLHAEIRDLPAELIEICSLVPPGRYDRQSLCDQMNSSISGHGWGSVYGTVD